MAVLASDIGRGGKVSLVGGKITAFFVATDLSFSRHHPDDVKDELVSDSILYECLWARAVTVSRIHATRHIVLWSIEALLSVRAHRLGGTRYRHHRHHFQSKWKHSTWLNHPRTDQ